MIIIVSRQVALGSFVTPLLIAHYFHLRAQSVSRASWRRPRIDIILAPLRGASSKQAIISTGIAKFLNFNSVLFSSVDGGNRQVGKRQTLCKRRAFKGALVPSPAHASHNPPKRMCEADTARLAKLRHPLSHNWLSTTDIERSVDWDQLFAYCYRGCALPNSIPVIF